MHRFLAVPLSICIMVLAACAQLNQQDGHQTVSVTNASQAGGRISQGIVSDWIVYTAGTLPRDPTSGNLVQGDMRVQANQVFDNLDAILSGAGCSLKDVIKMTVYMTDIGDSGQFNDAMAARFGETRPVLSTVQVTKLPSDAHLEVDVVAKIPR